MRAEAIKRLIVHKSDRLIIQLLRYGVVALVAFVVDFGLLYVLTQYLGIFYLVSATLSFTISLLVNYALSVRWVFEERSDRSQAAQLIGFAIIGFIGLGLNVAVIWLFTAEFGLYYLVSKLIATVIVFFWSFAARRYLLFRV